MLAPSGSRFDLEFEKHLSDKVREHHGHYVHCPSCIAPGKHSCLPRFAIEGQKPEFMLWFDPGEPHHPNEVFGINPTRAFTFTGALIADKNKWDSQHANSHFAAASYGRGLDIKNCVIYGSSEHPMARYLVDHQVSTLGAKSFISPWLDKASIVYDEVRETLGYINGSVDIRTQCKLAAIALVKFNAVNMEAVIGGDHVIGVYHDIDTHTLTYINPREKLINLFNGQTKDDVRPLSHRNCIVKPSIYFHSCCDSRAGARHLFGPQVMNGQSVAGFIPPDDVLIHGHSHSVWVEIEHAKRSGINRFAVLGHSQCGGAAGAVNMRLNNRNHGHYIDPWLAQATPIVDEVLLYAKHHYLSTDQIKELTEKQIVKNSAMNITKYLGSSENVHSYYLEINTRNVQKLDAFESIHATAQRLGQGNAAEYLYFAPPPANVFNPPTECPPTEHGRERVDLEGFEHLRWLTQRKKASPEFQVA